MTPKDKLPRNARARFRQASSEVAQQEKRKPVLPAFGVKFFEQDMSNLEHLSRLWRTSTKVDTIRHALQICVDLAKKPA